MKHIRLRRLILLAPTFLFGCAATGPRFSEIALHQSAGMANMVVFREDSLHVGGRSVRVAIDNRTAASIANAGFITFDIAPGFHTITADLWDAPGSCSTTARLDGGNRYYFQVEPRTAATVAQVAFGLVGAAIESSGNMCGGAFAIFPVTEEVALPILQNLRLSD